MKIDLKDQQGVQEYLDFLHGVIKTKDATIAEQGADIASLIEDQKEEYNKTENRFVDYEDEIAELVNVAKTFRSLDEILSPKSRDLLDALLAKHKDKHHEQ